MKGPGVFPFLTLMKPQKTESKQASEHLQIPSWCRSTCCEDPYNSPFTVCPSSVIWGSYTSKSVTSWRGNSVFVAVQMAEGHSEFKTPSSAPLFRKNLPAEYSNKAEINVPQKTDLWKYKKEDLDITEIHKLISTVYHNYTCKTFFTPTSSFSRENLSLSLRC